MYKSQLQLQKQQKSQKQYCCQLCYLIKPFTLTKCSECKIVMSICEDCIPFVRCDGNSWYGDGPKLPPNPKIIMRKCYALYCDTCIPSFINNDPDTWSCYLNKIDIDNDIKQNISHSGHEGGEHRHCDGCLKHPSPCTVSQSLENNRFYHYYGCSCGCGWAKGDEFFWKNKEDKDVYDSLLKNVMYPPKHKSSKQPSKQPSKQEKRFDKNWDKNNRKHRK